MAIICIMNSHGHADNRAATFGLKKIGSAVYVLLFVSPSVLINWRFSRPRGQRNRAICNVAKTAAASQRWIARNSWKKMEEDTRSSEVGSGPSWLRTCKRGRSNLALGISFARAGERGIYYPLRRCVSLIIFTPLRSGSYILHALDK